MHLLTKRDMEESLKGTDALIQRALSSKYLHEGEHTWGDVLDRMCGILKAKSEEFGYNAKDIDDALQMLRDGYFIPGGSIISGLREDTDSKRTSLSNCYVMQIRKDSIEGIFEALCEMARTYSYRGGCGVDITILRPAGTRVRNSANFSTGAVSFMPLISQMTEVIGQDKGRRGAAMISIEDKHPDLMSFIWCKADPERVMYKNRMNKSLLGRKLTGLLSVMDTSDPDISKISEVVNDDGIIGNITGANISVRISDEFMRAAEEDRPWVCVFPDIEANRELYDDKWDGDYEEWVEVGGTLKEYTTYTATIHKENMDRFVGQTLHLDSSTMYLLPEGIEASTLLLEETHIDQLIQYGHFTGTFDIPSAKRILHDIAHASWLRADPGIMFWDTATRESTVYDMQKSLKLRTSNPCSELAMGYFSACSLFSLVLPAFVKNPYTDNSELDRELFVKGCRLSVILLNLIIEINHDRHPLQPQRDTDKFSKRIGIEFTGLADMLSSLGYKYGGSPATIGFIEDIMSLKAIQEIKTSIELAKERGACEALNEEVYPGIRKRYVNQPYLKRLLSEKPAGNKIRADILKYGVRNIGFNCVGPTGTISIIMGNVSSGIEPVFAFSYQRVTRLDKDETYTICHAPVVKHLMNKYPDQDSFDLDKIKEEFHIVESHELDYNDRVAIQSAVQKYTDSSISSTVNLPQNTSVEAMLDIYVQAWKAGLKGITVYRAGSLEGVLKTIDGTNDNSITKLSRGELLPLPKKRRSITHEVKWMDSKVYIVVGVDDNERPFEVFVNLPREVSTKDDIFDVVDFNNKQSMWMALTRFISMTLRLGGDIDLCLKQLHKVTVAINDPMSLLIRVLTEYSDAAKIGAELKNKSMDEIESSEYTSVCPQCNKKTYIPMGGCTVCLDCGYSKCS